MSWMWILGYPPLTGFWGVLPVPGYWGVHLDLDFGGVILRQDFGVSFLGLEFGVSSERGFWGIPLCQDFGMSWSWNLGVLFPERILGCSPIFGFWDVLDLDFGVSFLGLDFWGCHSQRGFWGVFLDQDCPPQTRFWGVLRGLGFGDFLPGWKFGVEFQIPFPKDGDGRAGLEMMEMMEIVEMMEMMENMEITEQDWLRSLQGGSEAENATGLGGDSPVSALININ